MNLKLLVKCATEKFARGKTVSDAICPDFLAGGGAAFIMINAAYYTFSKASPSSAPALRGVPRRGEAQHLPRDLR